MILIDRIGHMVSTISVTELHEFAKKIGLKRNWFQQPRKGSDHHAHYDLTTKRKINVAIEEGAKLVNTEMLLHRAWWTEDATHLPVNICCLLCDKDSFSVYTTFFTDKNGRYRYGSICPSCYKEEGLDVPSNLRKR